MAVLRRGFGAVRQDLVPSMSRTTPRILAVSSGGGHWIELMRLRPAFEGADTAYVTVEREYRVDVPGSRFHRVNDATRWSKLAVLLLGVRMLLVLLRERPDVIITTGAAPGYIALRLGKWFGARRIWIDSIANVDELSMSGRRAGKHADLWLTQWAHLAAEGGPEYAGAVL